MIKVVLCVKQVPDTSDIKWTENNTIQREGLESIINPYDVYAAEFALKLKDELEDVEITVFSMGPAQAESMLRRLLALGCDKAVLISDKKFAGADTYATGKTISHAIKKVVPDFDLVVCGQFAVDGDTAQTGPCIASMLDIAQVTYVKRFTIADKKELTLERELEDGIETVKTSYPSLICVLQDTFEPRRPLINGIKDAQKKEVKVCSMGDIELTQEQCGLRGSPTFVSKAFRKVSKHNAKKYEISTLDSVELLKERIENAKRK